MLMAAVHASRNGMHLFRRNVGVFRQMFGPGKVRIGIKGQADIYGWDHTGRAMEIELKMHGKKLRPEQLQWAVVCVASSVRYYQLEQHRDETPDETVERWRKELDG